MTNLHLYNTLSRQKEEFKPLDPANVRMYVCGPTVYDYAHIGNARPVVVFDTLYRMLKRHYPKVTYVRNITDVDDKIMAKAKESGEPIESITARTTKAYHDDMGALNALSPDIEPRATQHIAQMIAMIAALIEKKHAYVAGGDVLFNVPSMKDYGELSRRSRDELVAGARVEVASYKKDPADFVLWKPSTPDQVGWDSPWGRGRPGWHIECSAMAKQHLGITFDIHGGGLDLIFPHHENEIAQSRCTHDGAPFAKYWMHNGFLTINNDKMSKSLGNFFTVHDLLKKFPGEALRLALLDGHYRQPLDFTEERLIAVKSLLDTWYRALQIEEGNFKEPENKEVIEAIDICLADDLNTVKVVKLLNALANKINFLSKNPTSASLNEAMKKASDKSSALGSVMEEQLMLMELLNKHIVPELKWLLKEGGTMVGLLQQKPEAWFKWQPAGAAGLSDADIDAQIAARLEARKNKNFAEADRIRKDLASKGVILEDGAGGTTWRRG